MLHVLVISDILVQPVSPLQVGPIGCPETLLTNYHSSLLDKHQLHRYLIPSRLLEYLGVRQEKQLRTGLSINIIVRGEICQVIDMASFL